MELMIDGAGEAGVAVGVGVSGATVAVIVGSGALVAEGTGAAVGSRVGEGAVVEVEVADGCGVALGMSVSVAVGLFCFVGTALAVAVEVIVGRVVDVLVKTASRQVGQEFALLSASRVWSYSS